MGFLLGPVILVLAFTVIVVVAGSFVVQQSKRGQPATVYFKTGVVAGDTREGVVTKRDRYITIKSEAGEEVFTWDQIRYIAEKTAPATIQVERVVDLFDLLSKLGIAATVLFFTVGLIQYGQAQKWEKEKFLAATVKEFIEWYRNRNAMAMIDSLALYPKGRVIELFPNQEKYKRVLITNQEIYAALTTDPATELDENDVRAVAIRECFDSFLSYMSTFRHYVDQQLITQDALSAHIGYWFDLLGPNGDLSAAHRERIFAYAREYKMTDFEILVEMYNKPSFWERIRGWFE